jgi:hypothetical protein
MQFQDVRRYASRQRTPPEQFDENVGGREYVADMENTVLAAVPDLETAVGAARKHVEHDLWSVAGGQVGDLLGRLHRLRAQVEAIELCLVREVGARGMPAEVGAVDTRTYLMGALTVSRPRPRPRCGRPRRSGRSCATPAPRSPRA